MVEGRLERVRMSCMCDGDAGVREVEGGIRFVRWMAGPV